MNASVEPAVWIDANQKLLVVELARIRSLVAGDRSAGLDHAATIAAGGAGQAWARPGGPPPPSGTIACGSIIHPEAQKCCDGQACVCPPTAGTTCFALECRSL